MFNSQSQHNFGKILFDIWQYVKNKMTGIQKPQRLAELNHLVFGNPLILPKILEHYVTEVKDAHPEPVSVHYITSFLNQHAPPEAPCMKLVTDHGNLLRQVNSEWEQFVIQLFTQARFPLNMIEVDQTGVQQLEQETHMPFALTLQPQHSKTLTESIFELGRFSLVELQLDYSEMKQMQHVPRLPQSFPSVRKLTIKCPAKRDYQDRNLDLGERHRGYQEGLWDIEDRAWGYNWQLYVQHILGKCINLKEVQVFATSQPNHQPSGKIHSWKYPASTNHLTLADLYLPPVESSPLQNLVSLCISFSLRNDQYHDKLVALLDGCKDSLQELILTGDPVGSSRIGILSFPVLSKLQTLITNQKVLLSDSELGQGLGLQGKVPVLEHLALEWSMDYLFEEDLFKGWIGHLQTQPLDTVKRFSWNISRDPLSTDQLLEKLPIFLHQLNAMLPNVERLEIRLPDLYLPGLSLVFNEMVQLTSLQIDVWNKRSKVDSTLQIRLWELLLIGGNIEQVSDIHRNLDKVWIGRDWDKLHKSENMQVSMAGLNNLKRMETLSLRSGHGSHLLSVRATTDGLFPVAGLRKLIIGGKFEICLEAAKMWKERGLELIVVT